jgi:hypothetical protein
MTRRILRCLVTPPGLVTERQVVFRVDLSNRGYGSPAQLRLHGLTPPLGPEGNGVPVLDDGQWPDAAAADSVYSAAVTFPAGAASIVDYWYATIGPCMRFSAWIDDPEILVDNLALLSVDRPDGCPEPAEAEPPAAPPADRLELAIRTGAAGAWLELAVLPGLAGKPLRVAIHDAAGRCVRRLEARAVPPRSRLLWDGRDERGRRVARGVYFVRVDANGEVRSAELLWIDR